MTQHAIATNSAPAGALVIRSGLQTPPQAIWDLLLDTGFLYPEKLAAMPVAAVRETLATLLASPSDLFKVSLAVKDERIAGHVSCVRVYAQTWLCQHLAASNGGKSALTAGRRLCVAMLEELEAEPTAEWTKIRWRPDNAWPAREFGGYARTASDRTRALLRTYAYAVSPALAADEPGPPAGLTLRSALPADLARVEAYFAATEQALYLRSDDLAASSIGLGHMQEAYARLGLARCREVIIAERGGRFAGFALLELSSVGLNFSEFTNSFRVYAAADDLATPAALARAARARYHALGYARCVALVDEPLLAAFEAAGFAQTKRYCCVTLHRSLLRELRAHLLRARPRETRP
jgi:hypothetical protein